MVVELTLDKFFKSINYKPAADSDGGLDYIDNTDDVIAAKFNTRWNANNTMLKNLQDMLEYLRGNSNSQKTLSFLIPDADMQIITDGEMPFPLIQDATSNWNIIIEGYGALVQQLESNKMTFPLGAIIDTVDPDNPTYTIVSGSSNLHEIQTDYPTTSKRWYRLGHDGAEGTPVNVRYGKNIAARARYPSCEIEFWDYQNNPIGKPQVIGFTSNENNEYIRLKCETNSANYLVDYSLWNGASLTTVANLDTGVARSTGLHKFTFTYRYNDRLKIILDTTIVLNSTTLHFEYLDDQYFESQNDSGSQDWFDVYYFHAFKNKPFAIVNGWNQIYLDLTDNDIKVSVNKDFNSRSNTILLYTVYRETGDTVPMITDYRNVSRFAIAEIMQFDRLFVNTYLTTPLAKIDVVEPVESESYTLISGEVFLRSDWVAADLTSALSYLSSNGGGLLHIPECDVTLTTQFTVPANTKIIGAGYNTLIRQSSNPTNGTFVMSDHSEIRDIRFIETSSFEKPPIYISSGVNDVLIENIDFEGSSGGEWIASGNTATITDIRIINNRFGDRSIVLGYTTRLVFHNNKINGKGLVITSIDYCQITNNIYYNLSAATRALTTDGGDFNIVSGNTANVNSTGVTPATYFMDNSLSDGTNNLFHGNIGTVAINGAGNNTVADNHTIV